MNFISKLDTKIVWTRYKGCLAKNPRNKSFKARYIYNLDINPPSQRKKMSKRARAVGFISRLTIGDLFLIDS